MVIHNNTEVEIFINGYTIKAGNIGSIYHDSAINIHSDIGSIYVAQEAEGIDIITFGDLGVRYTGFELMVFKK